MDRALNNPCCGFVSRRSIGPNSIPSRTLEHCEGCGSPMVVYVSVYANGECVVTAETRRAS